MGDINLNKENTQDFNTNDNMNNAYDNQQNQQNQQNQHVNYTNNYSGANVITPDKLKVEPTIACILSIFVTGLGQMLNGQLEKGLILLIGGYIFVFAISLLTCGIGAISAPILIVFSALDAYKCAQRLQSGQSIGKYEWHIFD